MTDEPKRIRMEVESVGESPHDFAQMIVRANGEGQRYRYEFPNGVPYKTGQHFYVTELPMGEPIIDKREA